MLNVLIIAAALAVAHGRHVDKRAADCPCTMELNIVCGENGQSYSNLCRLKCDGTTFAYSGPCAVQFPEIKKKEVCACTKELNVVCGQDGKSYGNPCLMQCAGTTLAHYGHCTQQLPVQFWQMKKKDEIVCACTEKLNLVCGQNGKTYDNPCIMRCAGTTFSYYGECAKQLPIYVPVQLPEIEEQIEEKESEECMCTLQWDPVCGSNGKSYGNKCNAICDGETDVRSGLCEDRKRRVDSSKRLHAKKGSCDCLFIYDPVCGDNGKTYDNKCQAVCDEQLVAYHGECSVAKLLRSLTSDLCPCQLNEDPVCANDGKTYANECVARCNNVSLMRKGRCSDVCKGVACITSLETVCADGVLYENNCVYECLNDPSSFGEPEPGNECIQDLSKILVG